MEEVGAEKKKQYYPKWFKVYIVETARGALYTGISGDPKYRVSEHNAGKGSKCLRGQLPVRLLWTTTGQMTKSEALKLEARIKKLTHKEKRKVVENGLSILETAGAPEGS